MTSTINHGDCGPPLYCSIHTGGHADEKSSSDVGQCVTVSSVMKAKMFASRFVLHGIVIACCSNVVMIIILNDTKLEK